jgi:hypothetical protein
MQQQNNVLPAERRLSPLATAGLLKILHLTVTECPDYLRTTRKWNANAKSAIRLTWAGLLDGRVRL